jgi:hypothetical protein
MKMLISDWIISLCALTWLAIMYFYERSQPTKLGAVWIFLPFLVSAAFRVVNGQYYMVAAAAVMVLLVAERSHLQSKLLERIIFAAAILLMGWMLFTAPLVAGYGIVGILVFWIAWELHTIEGEIAIMLITLQILWPGFEFISVYLVVLLVWAIIVRIREGGWLKSHATPGKPQITVAAAAFMAYQAYRFLLL